MSSTNLYDDVADYVCFAGPVGYSDIAALFAKDDAARRRLRDVMAQLKQKGRIKLAGKKWVRA